MAQASFVSTHHPCWAWWQEGAFPKASTILRTDPYMAQKKEKLIWCYGCWTWKLQQPLGFLILPKIACFFRECGCFLCRLICHSKGFEKHEPLTTRWRSSFKQGSAQQTLTRSGHHKTPPFGQTFPFREDKSKFKRKSWLDFVGWKGFTASFKSGMTDADGFLSFQYADFFFF